MKQRPLFDPSRTRAAAKSADATRDPRLLSVSQVTALVRAAVTERIPEPLHVVAEIGDLSRPGSGHLYFTLKDARSELRCVMWKSAAARLRFEPQSGLAVIATGQIDVYEPRGYYQLVVRTLEPRGTGALELAFRQLREKLEREGLFARERKRALPRFPFRIALITSPTGAAVRDLVRTIQRRFPVADVLLIPVRVQGDGAGREVASGIRMLNEWAAELGGVDLGIVARGGGSLEDLWAFNEEVVARAVVASAIPIISGVGHETDVTISDLVADVRAATPTAAAELATPSLPDVLSSLADAERRLRRLAIATLTDARRRFVHATSSAVVARPMRCVEEQRQRLDEAQVTVSAHVAQRLHAARERVRGADHSAQRLAGAERLMRLARRLDQIGDAARWGASRHIVRAERRVSSLLARLQLLQPEATRSTARERLAHLSLRLGSALAARLSRMRRDLDVRQASIEACHPRRILLRGFSIVRDARTARVLRSVRDVRDGLRIEIEVADGRFGGTADDPRQARLF